MKSPKLEALPPEIQALLAAERTIAPQNQDVRLRALSRARSAVAGAAAGLAGYSRLGPMKWAMTAAAFGAVGALLVARERSFARSPVTLDASAHIETGEPSPPSMTPTAAADPGPPLRSPPATASDPQALPLEVPHSSGRQALRPKSGDFELTILQRAQSAIARGDLPAALAAIDAHERRFPNGQLAEEREALRVQALTATGRKEEARRAAFAFAKRFPDSVLLPRIGGTLLAP